MEKKRNHFIPRFLLNRFASRFDARKKKHWIWEIRSDAAPKEISTRDAALATHFYGRQHTGVENALGPIETRFRTVLVAIDSGRSPEEFADDLRHFVWLQAARTRALREQFGSAVESLLRGIATALPSRAGQSVLMAKIPKIVDETIEKELSKVPLAQRGVARSRLQSPLLRQMLFDLAAKQLTEPNLKAISDLLIGVMEQKDAVRHSMKKGQVRALSHLLESKQTPEMFRPKHWHLVTGEPASVVLGDCCVVAVSRDNETGVLVKFGESWKEIYLPISASSVLVASHNSAPPELNPVAINRLSAELAHSSIFASRIDADTTSLKDLIGKRKRVLSDDEIAELVSSAFADAEKDR
jgi:hypothetical protein